MKTFALLLLRREVEQDTRLRLIASIVHEILSS
jgi:hypothetical protein